MGRRIIAAGWIAFVIIAVAACGDSGSSEATPTASSRPSPTPTPTDLITPTFGPSPTPSPTSCVGVAPSVDPITSPTTRRSVVVRGTGVTCGNNKRVNIDGPDGQSFTFSSCTPRNVFSAEVQLAVGDNHISVCQVSLCGQFCTELDIERRQSPR